MRREPIEGSILYTWLYEFIYIIGGMLLSTWSRLGCKQLLYFVYKIHHYTE